MVINQIYLKLATLIIMLIFSITNSSAIILPLKSEDISNKNFVGKWNIQTIVTDSNCPFVLVGSTTESKLEIKPGLKTKKSLKALWNGGDWSKSISTIKLLNEREAVTERTTEFETTDKNTWKAVLIDHLKLDEIDMIHSESIVIQYKNGLEVGQYKTYSILTKLDITN